MSELIIHAGAPKCGSSSLQSALSQNPRLVSRAGTRHDYVCLAPGGRLLTGRSIRRRATLSPYRYASSPNVTGPDMAETMLAPAAASILQMRKSGVSPILSSEGWANRADLIRDSGFVEQAGGNAHVILYVRPIADWLNSAWWQWGVWGRVTVARFTRANLHAVRWPFRVAQWQRVPGVERVSVRLATGNVVTDFFDLLDTPVPALPDANSGLPPAFLHFLLRNRKYRPNAHTSHVEFIVGRQITAGRVSSPWVLERPLLAEVMDHLRAVPETLVHLLAPEHRQKIIDDPRWWSPDAYETRPTDDPHRSRSADALSELVRVLSQGQSGWDASRVAEACARITASDDETERVAVADGIVSGLVDRMMRQDELQRARRRLTFV